MTIEDLGFQAHTQPFPVVGVRDQVVQLAANDGSPQLQNSATPDQRDSLSIAEDSRNALEQYWRFRAQEWWRSHRSVRRVKCGECGKKIGSGQGFSTRLNRKFSLVCKSCVMSLLRSRLETLAHDKPEYWRKELSSAQEFLSRPKITMPLENSISKDNSILEKLRDAALAIFLVVVFVVGGYQCVSDALDPEPNEGEICSNPGEIVVDSDGNRFICR